MTSDGASTQRSRRDDGVLETLAQLVEPLARAFGPDCEVVLHDLTNLDSSVYAIGGDLTGRSIGSPPTDLLLQHVLAGAESNLIGYETVLPDGRRCRSSTIFIRPRDEHRVDESERPARGRWARKGAGSTREPVPDRGDGWYANGKTAFLGRDRSRPPTPTRARPVAALCLNIDVTKLTELHALTGAMIGSIDRALPERATVPHREVFHNTINSLATEMVTQAIKDAQVPVSLMKKHHKLDVVSTLKEGGVFQLKDAVDIVSSALDVSRFTIYNYLNELQEDETEEDA